MIYIYLRVPYDPAILQFLEFVQTLFGVAPNPDKMPETV
jgi:hypothetical protein